MSRLKITDTLVLLSKPHDEKAMKMFEQAGGTVRVYPLMKIHETFSEDEEHFLSKLDQYDWFIFTSQHAVYSFISKTTEEERQKRLSHVKIAAVGEKTAQLIERFGMTVSFMPTIYNANQFVIEFPSVFHSNEHALFFRGSLAKDTLKKGLGNQLDEWTVYESIPDSTMIQNFEEEFSNMAHPILAFGSPSAVEQFTQLEQSSNKTFPFYETAAIGTITAEALKRYNKTIDYVPTTFTWENLVREILTKKGVTL